MGSAQKFFGFLFILTALSGCKPLYDHSYTKPELVDVKPSRPTKVLHKRLYKLSAKGFGIGHQDDMAYGIGWKRAGKDSSDVKAVTGSLPAVFGFDIAGIEKEQAINIDSVPFDMMRALMIKAHKQGGIVTVSWHADNPVSGGNSWDQTRALTSILEDATIGAEFDQWLSRAATFLKSVKYRGRAIPIVFRPWHEMNGHWFWWGEAHRTPEEYKALWVLTVQQLREKYGVHNLLYAYSPNRVNSKEDYLKSYPGDAYVDLLGIDIYDFENEKAFQSAVKENLALVKELANEKKKMYAFTETGLEKISKQGWFDETLYPALADSGIAWVLFWRNYSKGHHYVPYPGHKAAEDFKRFEARPQTLFLNDVNRMKY